MRSAAPLVHFTSLVVVLLCAVATKAAHLPQSYHHFNHTSNHTLQTRQDGSRYSYYYIQVAEVACGGWYKDSDFVSLVLT